MKKLVKTIYIFLKNLESHRGNSVFFRDEKIQKVHKSIVKVLNQTGCRGIRTQRLRVT